LRNDVLGSSRESIHRAAKVSGEIAPMKRRVRYVRLSETLRVDAPTGFTTAVSPARKSSLVIDRPSHHGNFPFRRPDGRFSRPAFIYDRSTPNISPLVSCTKFGFVATLPDSRKISILRRSCNFATGRCPLLPITDPKPGGANDILAPFVVRPGTARVSCRASRWPLIVSARAN
jgi:hypothetical protein